MRDEARQCLDYHGDLYLACVAWQRVKLTSWDEWLDLLGRDYVDQWLAERTKTKSG